MLHKTIRNWIITLFHTVSYSESNRKLYLWNLRLECILIMKFAHWISSMMDILLWKQNVQLNKQPKSRKLQSHHYMCTGGLHLTHHLKHITVSKIYQTKCELLWKCLWVRRSPKAFPNHPHRTNQYVLDLIFFLQTFRQWNVSFKSKTNFFAYYERKSSQ